MENAPLELYSLLRGLYSGEQSQEAYRPKISKVKMQTLHEWALSETQQTALTAAHETADYKALIEWVGEGDSADFIVAANDGSYEIWDAGERVIPRINPPLALEGEDSAEKVIERLIHLSRFLNMLQLENDDASTSENVPRVVLEWQHFDRHPIFPPNYSADLLIYNDSSFEVEIALLSLHADMSVQHIYPIDGTDSRTFAPYESDVLTFETTLDGEHTEQMTMIKAFATVGKASFRMLALPSLDQTTQPSDISADGQDALEQLLTGQTSTAIDRWTITQIELWVDALAEPDGSRGAYEMAEPEMLADGDQIEIGSITGSTGAAIGRGASASISGTNGGGREAMPSIWQTRRVDLAMPPEGKVGETTELRALVALVDSEGLRKHLPDYTEGGSRIGQEDVRDDSQIDLEFTSENRPIILYMRVEPNEKDFKVITSPRRIVLHHNRDSNQQIFLLEPLRALDAAYVPVELYADKDCFEPLGSAGTAMIKIVADAPPAGVRRRANLSLAATQPEAPGERTTPLPNVTYVIYEGAVTINNGDVITVGDVINSNGIAVGSDSAATVTTVHNGDADV